MESASSIMNRLFNGPAASQPHTMNQDGQLSAQHLEEKQSSTPKIIQRAGNAVQSVVESVSQRLHPDENKQASSSTSGTGYSGSPMMTSVDGFPMQDCTHSLNINGYPVTSDRVIFEKQQSFNRAKLPERPVHPCGSGAGGYFICTKDVSKYTKASFLSQVGKKTPVMARFSTVTYGREYPDSARNPRGLAWKFYTEDGNYDVLQVNFPCFFVRDGAMGPDLIRSQQRHPQSFGINFDAMFDFMSLVPESTLSNLWFWSDHGTPRGWRHMDGYAVHTFSWVNAANELVYIRYHFKAADGIQNFTYQESVEMCGVDPDFAKRDLYQHLEMGKTVEWICCVQMMTPQQAKEYRFDPFDNTKVWLTEDFPEMEFGRIVIDRNPENYHRDVEQIAFSPGSLVPGIEGSPDPLLQFRMFLYRDAQIHRLGINYHQIPVNCPFMARQYNGATRDGALRSDDNGGVAPNYYPNSYSVPPHPLPNLAANPKPMPVHGVLQRASASKHGQKDADPSLEYEQARLFYLRTLTPQERSNLHVNIAQPMMSVTREEVKLRFLAGLYKVSPDLVQGVLDVIETYKANPSLLTASKSAAAESMSLEQLKARLAKADPKLTLSNIQKLADSAPHMADTQAGYIPVPINV